VYLSLDAQWRGTENQENGLEEAIPWECKQK